MQAIAIEAALPGVAPSDVELTARLLGTSSALARAARLLRVFGGPHGLSRAGRSELERVGDLTPLEAERLEAALELGRRAVDVPLARGEAITSGVDVYARLRAGLGSLEQEELHVLGLDTLGRLCCAFVVAVGALNQLMVNPREVFRPLIREGASSAIVVHNHPSGNPEPSADDAELTSRLCDAGELVGIPLVDHVVVARDGYHSFAERGRIRRRSG